MATKLITVIDSQLPKGYSGFKNNNSISLNEIDILADELVLEYDNVKFRKWYCGVARDFGASKVYEWRRRAAEGNEPAKLFSKYVQDYRTHTGARRS